MNPPRIVTQWADVHSHARLLRTPKSREEGAKMASGNSPKLRDSLSVEPRAVSFKNICNSRKAQVCPHAHMQCPEICPILIPSIFRSQKSRVASFPGHISQASLIEIPNESQIKRFSRVSSCPTIDAALLDNAAASDGCQVHCGRQGPCRGRRNSGRSRSRSAD